MTQVVGDVGTEQRIPLAPLSAVQSFGPWYFIKCCAPANAREPRREWWDAEHTDLSRNGIIKLVMSGEWDNLDRIYCAEDGRFYDATNEIAEAIIDRLTNAGERPGDDLRTWLEETMGEGAIRRIWPVPLENAYVRD